MNSRIFGKFIGKFVMKSLWIFLINFKVNFEGLRIRSNYEKTVKKCLRTVRKLRRNQRNFEKMRENSENGFKIILKGFKHVAIIKSWRNSQKSCVYRYFSEKFKNNVQEILKKFLRLFEITLETLLKILSEISFRIQTFL